MILKCVKETVLRNGDSTVLFERGAKIVSATIEGNMVKFSYPIEGYKKWFFNPDDWRRESSPIE